MATTGGTPAAAGDNLRRLTDLYRMMVRIRTFEATALEAYKAGERSHPTMQGIAGGLSEQDMADLAAYYGVPK